MPARLIVALGLLAAGLFAEPAALARTHERLPLAADWWNAYPPTLRWDALDDAFAREYPVQTQGGERVIRLPAGSWLRVQTEEEHCGAGIEVLHGNGSGIFAQAAKHCSTDGYSSLYPPLPGDGERVLRVRDLRMAASPARLYASRSEASPDPASRLLPLALDTANVRVEGLDGQVLNYQQVMPRRGGQRIVEGPARLVLHSRLIYPGEEGREELRPAAHCAAPVPPQTRPGSVDHYRITLNFESAQDPVAGTDERMGGDETAAWVETLELDTTPAYHQPVRIDGCFQPTGQRETRHLDVPPGRFYLDISSSSPVLVRLSKVDENAFLLPGLNGPTPDIARMRAQNTAVDPEPAYRLQLATSLRLSNTRPEGSLSAIARLSPTLEQIMGGHPLDRVADEWRGRHSYWRNLAPFAPDRHNEQMLARVLMRPLTPLRHPHRRLHVAHAQLDALSAGLSPVLFSRLPAACTAATTASGEAACTEPPGLRYRLPARQQPAWLQVLVDVTPVQEAVRLWLQFDDQPAQVIELRPAHESTAWETLPDRISAALALLQAEGDPLAARARLLGAEPPLPWLRPASVQFELPPATRQVRIWSTDPLSRNLQLGLRYRVAKTERLSPDEYLREIETLSPRRALAQIIRLLQAEDAQRVYLNLGRHVQHESANRALQSLRKSGQTGRLRFEQQTDGSHTIQLQAGPFEDLAQARDWWQSTAFSPRPAFEPQSAGLAKQIEGLTGIHSGLQTLLQHWLPDLRLLQDRLHRFKAPLAPLPDALRLSQSQAKSRLEQARAAWQNGDLPGTLHALPLHALWPDSSQAIEAMSLRDKALGKAGETYIADMQLRVISLQARDSTLADWASERLLQRYRAKGQQSAIEGLLVARMLADVHRQDLWAGRLSQALIEHGQVEAGLWLSLLVEPGHQPLEDMLLASLELRHWSLFDRLLNTLGMHQRARWQGYRLLHQGREAEAREVWQKYQATDLLDHLEQGAKIREHLQLGEPVARLHAVQQWRSWQSATPGLWGWKEQAHWVTGHAGILQSHIHSRDLLQAGYTATEDKPLTLSMQGPALLRLEVRPLHDDTQTPQEGWVRLTLNGQNQRLPLFHNRAVAGWNPLHQDSLAIGQAVSSVLELGPGTHQLSVHAGDIALLTRVQAWRPRMPMPLLPQTSPDDEIRALQGDWRARMPAPRDALSRPRLIELKQCQQLDLDTADLAGNIPPLAAPSCGRCTPATRATDTQIPEYTSPSWQRAYWNPPVSLDDTGRPASARDALLRAAWQADRAPEALDAQLAAAALALNHPELAESAGVLRRLQQRTRWQAVLAPPESLQMAREQQLGWQPMGDGLQLRKALMPAFPQQAHLLAPGQRLNLHLRRLREDTLKLRIRLHELPGIAGVNAHLQLQQDDGRSRTLVLRPDRTQRLRLTLPAGDHQISLHWPEGYASQFVSVELSDDSGDIPAQSQREFWLSTADQPLRLQLQGPALLAIRHWDGQRASTRYHHLSSTDTQLNLPPPAGSDRALYRLSSLRLDVNPPAPAPIRRSHLLLDGLPSGWLGAEQDRPALYLDDALALGRQQNGTLSAALSWRQLGADEDSGLNIGGREYLQTSAIYRRAFNDRHWVLRAEALLRRHPDVSWGHGLHLDLDHRSEISPWRQTLSLDLNHHEQDRNYIGARLALGMQRDWRFPPDWRANLQLQAQQRLVPKINPRVASRMDAEVSSLYLRAHTRRLRLGASLTHEPWLDTRLRLGTTLNSNDPLRELGLDNARLRLEAAQLLGDWDLSAQMDWQLYMKDADRGTTRQQRRFGLALVYDRWHRYDQRWHLTLNAAIEPDIDSYSLGLTLEYSLAAGRIYRDFRSAEVDFRSLRTRKAHGELENNRLRESVYGW